MRLFWRVYLWLFTVAMAAFLAAGLHANRSLRRVYREQVSTELRTQADWLASELLENSRLPSAARVDARCKELGRLTRMRVTVILPDGQVTGDSDSDPATMENHGNRPEIMEALAGRVGRSERFSDTMRRTLSYLAVPVRRDGQVVATVRTSMPLADIDRTLVAAYQEVALGVLVVAVLFAVVASFLVRRISRPLDDMRQAAERLANGELDTRVEPPTGGAEMRSLARALNQMAELLGARLETITQQSNELKAVFSSMSEGVLAVDSGGRVLNLNAAAEQWLGMRTEQGRGRLLEEAVRQPDLQKFIQGVLASGADAEAEILLDGERFLHLHGTLLKDALGGDIGVLVVLSDTTRVKRLEQMRQDFVANVSHELKTPITALRGCVDTLADPDRQDTGDDRRFIAMMERQVDRLWAIVGDLLSLSRLEHDGQNGRILLEPGPVGVVLRRAVSSFSTVAADKRISLAAESPGELTAPINAALLEQAVGNLVDNAIKYSGEDTRVSVKASADAGQILIQVQDEGPGIEQHHLPRLFERFYRVDQARSRALGGTGLGLAIVKHIAQAHGGSVSVDSTPGRGSTFSIRFPAG